MNLLEIFSLLILMSSGSENTAGASTTGRKALAFAAPSDDTTSGSSQEEIPKLPASDPNNKDIPSIKLGETIKFDEMGPIIINLDGTTRRIDNWSELSEREKEVTWRRISKRNEERRKILLEQTERDQQEAECKDDKE
jgi:hypothetical protein